ncbi:hypothetical protein L3X38_025877 [Prunus dulcis]|uniref:HAT C-terminal dimerisation domain-containing protein n=1 Tax=Prunus dulcis TaxID=3755 RepID=A0AAD4W3N5_PRUDU|nr:hypothetical protein L3X38_025877 [Prunus dulcis]
MKHKWYWGSFEGVNKIVFIGNVLEPRWKLALLKIIFHNLGAESSKVETIGDEVKSDLLTLYNEYKGVGNLGSLQTLDEGDEEGLEDELDDDDAHSQREMLLQKKEEQQMEISNEVDKCFADPFENPRNKNFNLLDWWKGNQSRYPTISKVAKDIFAISSSTVASENAFSLGKRIVDPFRSSLTPKMVDALVYTHDWLRVDEFNLYKEPTDEEIGFYKELEEIQAMANKAQGGNVQVSTSTSILPPPTPSHL